MSWSKLSFCSTSVPLSSFSLCHCVLWYCYLKLLLLLMLWFTFYLPVFLPYVLLLLLFTFVYVCCELSNPSSFCYGTTTVQDDAAPGTQEYIMLRQDSIHSADIRSKGSPFRAKCHEIFCCPLKQAVHKESAEPEGLFAPPPCFDLLMLLVSPAHSHLTFPSLSYSVWTDSSPPLQSSLSFLSYFFTEHLVCFCPFLACVSVHKHAQMWELVCVFERSIRSNP